MNQRPSPQSSTRAKRTPKRPDCALTAFNFPPLVGGLEFYLQRLFVALDRKIEVVVLAPKMKNAHQTDEQLPFEVVRRPMLADLIFGNEFLFKPLYPLLCLLIFFWTLVVFAQRRPKMICAASGNFAWAVGLAAKILRARFCWICFAKDGHVRPTWFSRIGKGLPLRWTLRHADITFVISRYAWDILDPERRFANIRLLQVPIDKMHAPPPSEEMLNHVRRVVWGDGDKRGPMILSVGRLRDYKGFQHVIEALKLIEDEFPEARYAIVGSGPCERELWRTAARLGVDARVVFVGTVDSPDPYYALADVFVTVSWDVLGQIEGFGMVFLEAACFGVPSIAGTSGGMTEAVIDGETGYCVEGASPEAIAGALRKLLSDEDLRRRLGENARRYAESFDPMRIAGQFILDCHLENDKA